MSEWTEILAAHGACSEAVEWAQKYDSFAAAWVACGRADWLLWWIGRVDGHTEAGRRRLVGLAADCADVVPQEAAGRAAINLARRWAQGEAIDAWTLRDASASCYAAYAASAAATYAAAAAASAAAYAAAVAVADAAYTAYATAAAAAADAAAYDAYAEVHRQNCARIRAVYPEPPMPKGAA